MKLLLTDCEKTYLSSSLQNKILFSGLTIKKDTFLKKEVRENIITSLGSCEFLALDKTLEELYKISDTNLVSTRLNDVLSKRTTFLRNMAIFLPLYKLTYLANNSLLILLSKFNEGGLFKYFTDVSLVLSQEYALPNYNQLASLKIQVKWDLQHKTKSFFYSLSKLIKTSTAFIKHAIMFYKKKHQLQISKISNNKILLVLYNIPHHQQVLSNFFELVKKNPKIHLDIILYDLNFIPQNHKTYLKNINSDNIRVYEFSDFAKPKIPAFFESFHIWKRNFRNYSFEKIYTHINSTLTAYTWMQNAFKLLKPTVCFQMSIHETGRYMADVANLYSVPSAQVDYALFSDNPNMESHICYSKRFPISAAISEIWKKRKDPTPIHTPVGYCKFDSIVYSSLSKNDFLSSIGLNPERKTIFFASTWADEGSAYLEEKKIIIEKLSTLCAEQKWNFLVKKHPLEFDDIANVILKDKINLGQVSLSHQQISIYDAIRNTDLVINQMSSIVLECLYFDKPFCYLSSGSENSISDISILKNESFAFNFNDFTKFEQFAQNLLNDSSFMENIILEIKTRKSYFLYKTDGKASQRLLNELLLLQN